MAHHRIPRINWILRIPRSDLRPMQTDATRHNTVACCWGFLVNNVASVCMGLKVWPVSNSTQQVPTMLWFHANGRNMLNPTMLRPFAWALKTRLLYKKSGPGISHVQFSFSRRRVNISFYASPISYLLLTAPKSKWNIHYLLVSFR